MHDFLNFTIWLGNVGKIKRRNMSNKWIIMDQNLSVGPVLNSVEIISSKCSTTVWNDAEYMQKKACQLYKISESSLKI